jgi:DNA-binding NarL/FixJ family response regulator
VLDLLARGLFTREVATRLAIPAAGVRVHTASLMKKLGARDRDEAVAALRRTSGVTPFRASRAFRKLNALRP